MIETARLLLRPWRDVDREPMHRMGRDSKVMEFLGPLQSRAQSDMFIDRMIALQEQNGHCFWALERQQDSALLGLRSEERRLGKAVFSTCRMRLSPYH